MIKMTKQEYIAVIGDIYDSRLLENREEVQRKLLDVLETINKKYQEEWVSKCSISMGIYEH